MIRSLTRCASTAKRLRNATTTISLRFARHCGRARIAASAASFAAHRDALAGLETGWPARSGADSAPDNPLCLFRHSRRNSTCQTQRAGSGYTWHSLAPFARDLGCAGPPFVWDEDRRAVLRADLDRLLRPRLRADARRAALHPRPRRREGADYPSETFRVLRKEGKEGGRRDNSDNSYFPTNGSPTSPHGVGKGDKSNFGACVRERREDRRSGFRIRRDCCDPGDPGGEASLVVPAFRRWVSSRIRSQG